MDCISPDHLETELSELFIRVSLNAIRAAIPFDADDTEASREEKYQAAVQLFHGQKPRNADEAALATRYVIGHFRYLHLSACTASRDLSDDKALRLNAAAATADRLANATHRAIKAAQKPAPAAERGTARGLSTRGHAAPVSLSTAAQRVPLPPRFQPRDCHGEPIPHNRWDLMTMAQRRATYAPSRDPELEAIAIAEEEEMIAAQAAQAAQQSESYAASSVAT